jgi:hypothetical protein
LVLLYDFFRSCQHELIRNGGFCLQLEVFQSKMGSTISRRTLDERKYSCKLGGSNFDVPMVAAK